MPQATPRSWLLDRSRSSRPLSSRALASAAPFGVVAAPRSPCNYQLNASAQTGGICAVLPSLATKEPRRSRDDSASVGHWKSHQPLLDDFVLVEIGVGGVVAVLVEGQLGRDLAQGLPGPGLASYCSPMAVGRSDKPALVKMSLLYQM